MNGVKRSYQPLSSSIVGSSDNSFFGSTQFKNRDIHSGPQTGDSFFGTDSKVFSRGRPRSCRGEALKQYEHHLHAERRRHLISVKNISNREGY
ncbi:hypothetical protein ATANTOWER_019564 [Ataeniobius toweri]|uniref:Uncharacterized protein n=1 Tax=Ataeniobius toweri TaxID=208326 RepID=A0ABU7AAP2_9TELE|nr:hypothetical protein [Ataeniobius toweri]